MAQGNAYTEAQRERLLAALDAEGSEMEWPAEYVAKVRTSIETVPLGTELTTTRDFGEVDEDQLTPVEQVLLTLDFFGL